MKKYTNIKNKSSNKKRIPVTKLGASNTNNISKDDISVKINFHTERKITKEDRELGQYLYKALIKAFEGYEILKSKNKTKAGNLSTTYSCK